MSSIAARLFSRFGELRPGRVPSHIRGAPNRPALRALVGALLGNAPGFVLPFAVAAHFSIGRVTDAYVYAFSIALVGLTLCISTIEQNVLPVARVYADAGGDSLLRFARRTALQASLVVALADLPIAGLGGLFLFGRHSWLPWERHLSLMLSFMFLILVAVAAANSVINGCLYALGEFFVPTSSQASRSFLPGLLLLFLGHGAGSAQLLGLSVVVGEVARSPFLIRKLRKLCAPIDRASSTPRVRSVWATAAPASLGLIVLAANPIIDRAVAARFQPGSVTVIDLGEKVFYVPLTVLQYALVLVAGARWARLANQEPMALSRDIRATVRQGVAISVVFTAAVIAAMSVFSMVVSHIGGVPTGALAKIVDFFALGLPAATVSLLAARALTATRNTLPLIAPSALGLIVNVIADILGAAAFGVRGIALASALVWTVNAALLLAAVRRSLDSKRHDTTNRTKHHMPSRGTSGSTATRRSASDTK